MKVKAKIKKVLVMVLMVCCMLSSWATPASAAITIVRECVPKSCGAFWAKPQTYWKYYVDGRFAYKEYGGFHACC